MRGVGGRGLRDRERGSEIRGRDTIKQWVHRFLALVDDSQFHVIETFQNHDGTRVASLWEVTGRNNGTRSTEPDGSPVHLTGTAVWDVGEDGMRLRDRVECNASKLHQRLMTN